MIKKIALYLLIFFIATPFFVMQSWTPAKAEVFSETFTSGSGTFNVPAGATNLIIEVWGGVSDIGDSGAVSLSTESEITNYV